MAIVFRRVGHQTRVFQETEGGMSKTLNKDARFWDKAARKYALSAIADKDGYERSLQATTTYLNSADRVLEVGCGTGTTALRLAPHVGHIHATDISSEMIAIAREKAGLEPFRNIEFEVGANEFLELAPDSFDAVLAFNLLHLVGSLEASLTCIYRLVKPGGQFISKTPCLSLMSPLIGLAIPVMKAIGKAPTVQMFTPCQLQAAITGVGFEIDKIEWHGTRGKDVRPYIIATKP